jgi:hypothetical protein
MPVIHFVANNSYCTGACALLKISRMSDPISSATAVQGFLASMVGHSSQATIQPMPNSSARPAPPKTISSRGGKDRSSEILAASSILTLGVSFASSRITVQIGARAQKSFYEPAGQLTSFISNPQSCSAAPKAATVRRIMDSTTTEALRTLGLSVCLAKTLACSASFCR